MMTYRSLLNSLTGLMLIAAPLDAQQPSPPASSDSAAATQDTPALIVLAKADGTRAGARVGIGGWLAGGFMSGFLLGFVGTSLTWAVASHSDPRLPVDKQLLIANQPATYRLVYEKAFTEKVKARRKSSALIGGLVGTITVFSVFVASY